LLFRQKEQNSPSATVPSDGKSVAEPEKTLSLVLPYARKGAAWRTRVTGQVQSEGKWLDNCIFVVRYDVVEVNPQDGAHVVITFEDCISKLSDPSYAGSMKMKDRRFDCRVTPDGRVQSLDVHDGKSFDADNLRYYVWACDAAYLSSLFSPKTLVPGDEWSDRSETILPAYQDSVLITDYKSRFTGYARREGEEVGVIHTVSKFHYKGNVPLKKSKTPNQIVEVTLLGAEILVEGDYFINLQSGLPIARQDSGAETMLKANITTYAKGRQVPVQEEVVKDTPTPFRHSSDIEYLQ
jgi:hypothetical protein